MSQSIEVLKWRYAVKKYNTEKKLSEEQLGILKESLRLAPSSFGLQPWHFVVVEDAEIRKKLRAVGYDQSAITDASQLIVLATEKDVDAVLVEKYIQNIALTRNVPIESLEGLRTMIDGAVGMKGEEGAREWAGKQVYIALGVLLTTASIEGIDATPMEGFDPKEFDTILGLDKRGLMSRVIVAVGFRSEADDYAKEKKVRYSEEEVFTTI